MASPTRRQHGEPHAHIITWLGVYAAATPGVSVGDAITVRLDPDNEVQPDALLRISARYGGQSTVDADDYLAGGPELVVEVAASTTAYDLHTKKNVYRRNGVREYVVWRVYDQEIDWFVLEAGRYLAQRPDAAGLIHSQVFPGLVLAATAMVEGDLAAVLGELQRTLTSAEHQAFRERLRQQGPDR